MDQEIQKRLEIFEQEKLAQPAVVGFVREILQWLEDVSRHPCTEETAGPFASHLMLALTRVQNGEDLAAAWSPDVHEEAEKLSVLAPWVEHIQQQAQQKLTLTLPEEEMDFVLIHLGTFLIHYSDALVADLSA